MGSPVIFSGKYSKLLTQSGVLTKSGAIINNDGEKNYLPLGNAETTNPWVMYDDAAAIPVDGTGGSTSATVTQSSTNPLTGYKSFIFTPHSALGEGAAYSFTLDREDKYKLIHCDLSYEVASGTYATGDLAVYLYDVTNSQLLTPFSTHLLANVGIPSTQRFTFQATDSTSYRLLIHQVTNNSGYTIKFETKLGPKDFAGYSSIQADPISYTPIFTGLGTVSNIDIKYARDGKYLLVEGTFRAGTPTASAATMTLPSGLNISSNINSNSGSINHIVGSGWRAAAGGYEITVLANPAYPNVVYFGYYLSPNDATTSKNGNDIIGTNEYVSLSFKLPIDSWSGTSPIISDYDGRVVAMKRNISANTVTTANTAINFDSPVHDTHGMWDAVNFRANIKYAGFYRIGMGAYASTNTSGYIKATRAAGNVSYMMGSANVEQMVGSTTIELAVGDYVEWMWDTSSVTLYQVISGGSYATFAEIEMLSGAQQIQAGHKIYGEYYKASSQALTANVTKISFTGLISDSSLGSWSTDTFTSKVNGSFQINLSAISGSPYSVLYIVQTGSKSSKKILLQAGATGYYAGGSAATTLDMAVGDTFYFLSDSSVTLAGGTDGATGAYLVSMSFSLIGSHLLDQKKFLNYEAILMDKQTSGTAGGTAATATWTARNLNTRSSDPDNIIVNSASFTGTGGTNSTITLSAGTYAFYGRSPHYMANRYAKCRLYNATDASVIEVGTNIYNNNGSDECEVRAQFTLASQKDIQLQYWFNSAVGASDLGVAVTSGSDEVYSIATIRKIS